jgi:hypothetical protein
MTFIVIIVIIATFIFGLFSFLKYRSPEYKGAVGESIVSKEISKLSEREYKILNNIYS